MIHEKKAKTLLKKIIKKAQLDPNIRIVVRDEEGTKINENFTVNEIIESIFSVDISEVNFANVKNEKGKKYIGWLFIVLEYNSDPEEIINDYSANEYTENLLKEFINY
tara:strand:+ start:937 stop:1260 length:324 start_codon:yes stop_codon:yes gene_type:complete